MSRKDAILCSVALDASFSCNSTQTILGRRHFGIRCIFQISFLEEVNEIGDLGITTDQHLRWNLHIGKGVAKANGILELIKRNCRDFDDRKTLRTLYCALVRLKIKFRVLLCNMVPLHQEGH